ncbi:MAG: CCA tRNA nucleotidyltransferase [Candidatus Nanoarchaeia archaeon]|nr:CCA tRNA nucleotidyltransferase [Candidatus Nanoarchaeia archaeon]
MWYVIDMINAGALNIIKTLRDNGHQAVLAGGSVRDILLGIEPHDWDIATSATPDQVEKIFPKTIAVGKSFGVMIVLIDDEKFEVATFRKDSSESDGRRPDSVEFCNMEEDAKRRDFTINGMFFDPIENKVIDFVGGQDDLKNGIVRFIGDPEERIKEDYLRMLRFARFELRFSKKYPEQISVGAILKNNHLIQNISQERIVQELFKILNIKKTFAAINFLYNLKLIKYIIPEIESMINIKQPEQFHPEGDVWTHTLLVCDFLDKMNADPELILAGLLHDIGKPSTQTFEDRIRFNGHDKAGVEIATKICERLKLSNDQTKRILWLIETHMWPMNVSKKRKSKLKMMMDNPYFEDLLKLHEADCLASHVNLDNLNFMKEKYEEFKIEKGLPQPLINGGDLLDMGLTAGPLFGKILKIVRELQLDGVISTKEQAIEQAKGLIKDTNGTSNNKTTK